MMMIVKPGIKPVLMYVFIIFSYRRMRHDGYLKITKVKVSLLLLLVVVVVLLY